MSTFFVEQHECDFVEVRVAAFEIDPRRDGEEPERHLRVRCRMDIDPQPPGEDLDYFGRDDPTYWRDRDCPDEKYFRQRGIYTT